MVQSSLFFSYSRRELPFVNDLAFNTEKFKCKTWLDNRNLVPGKAWKQQIFNAIAESDIFVLVVSKESIASKNVELEWREAIAQNKRVILVFFEAVKLPSELKECEWVDFRTSFKPSIKALIKQISEPKTQVHSPPEEGFRAPAVVWLSFFVAIALSILSLATMWTLYLPYYLIPLPYRVLKRDFEFNHVQGATFILPFFLFFNLAFFSAESPESGTLATTIFSALTLLSLPISILFLLLLRSPGLQRWGKPIASRLRFRNPYKIPPTQNVQAVAYYIDYAIQDTRYARLIMKVFGQYGHQLVENENDAQVALVLISRFKKTTHLNPEQSVVYPVLLQGTESIDPNLKLIQWIDFRRGIKKIKQFSVLVGEPAQLLKALGVPPGSQQTVLPTVVQLLEYLITFLSMNILGIILLVSILEVSQFYSFPYIGRLAFVLIALSLITNLRLDLINRDGKIVRSVKSLFLSLMVMVMLTNIIASTSFLYDNRLSPINFDSENFDPGNYTKMVGISIGLAIILPLINFATTGIMAFISLIYWRELRRWIPFYPPKSLGLIFRKYLTKTTIIVLLAMSFLVVSSVLSPLLTALSSWIFEQMQ
jgi:hypothetical protein